MATNRLRVAPVTNKGTERVIAILEAAKDVLVEEGFAALSLREVAKRADMTVGNVGYYFPSKDSLLAALAEHIFDRWDARLRRHAPPDLAGGLPTFVYSIRFMIEENKRPKTKSLLLEMWAMANRSRAIRLMMDTFYGRMRGWIEAMLAEIDPGHERPYPPAARGIDHRADRGPDAAHRPQQPGRGRADRGRGGGDPADPAAGAG